MTTVSSRDQARQALLAQRLRKRRRADAASPGIPPRPADTPLPLSAAQERVWFMEQLAPGEAAYHIAVPIRVRSVLDLPALRRALDALAARHESLRTTFPADEDGAPLAVVHDTVEVPLSIVDAGDEDEAWRLVDEETLRPFDLAAGPLLRARLIRITEDSQDSRGTEQHILLLTMHHIVGDGWSVDVLLRDLIAGYRGMELPPMPIQYGDFAHWEAERLAGEQTTARLDYWRERLAGVAPLELPTDRPRPPTQTYSGDFVHFQTSAELAERLRTLSRTADCTLFMTLLAAYQVFLARHANAEDFAVGVSVAGRSAPELENVVGMFINMLPMRAELRSDHRRRSPQPTSGDPSFTGLLARTRQSVLDAFEHGDLPFAKIVQALGVPRDVSRSPVFQAMFVLQNYEIGRFVDAARAAGTGEASFEWVPIELRATRFDLELHLGENRGRLWGKLVYNTDLFDAATVQRMASRFTTLLESIVDNPAAPVSALALLDADERAKVVTVWNDTGTDFPATQTLHEPIEAQAASTPAATALVFEKAEVSYAELNERANRIAHRLRALGVGPETLVGVFAERSVELVAGLLGVLKAGGAYVPLDPEYPIDRIAFMLADSGAAVVLTQSHLRDTLPPTGATVLLLDDATQWAAQPTTDPEPVASADNQAYLIYTSGSTGRPKGVPNTHRGIVNRLHWMQRAYRLGTDDAVLQKTPASFDVSVWEFFWPLRTGARLVLARPGGHKDAGYLRDLLIDQRITTAHFVPSMLTIFLAEDGIEACRRLRRVICSGEELPVATARDFLARFPGCELHNLYGPTEAAVDVSAYHCRAADLAQASTVPIGAPIDNIGLYVLDGHGNPAPIGVPGHLHIGGVGLARGYHRRPALTAERFVPNPFGPGRLTAGGAGNRLYATGDLARWRSDGLIEFLGRLDNQVKLRGLRIELGEIESVLRRRDDVAEIAVIVREDHPGDKRLVAYLVGPADHADCKSALKQTLPDYMVPAAFVTLDALPLSPNGKLDRKALPAPTTSRDTETELVVPRTGTEQLVADIWRESLGVDELGIDDDFFDLGGHSLLATKVVARIRKRETGGRPVGVMDLFQHRTVRTLAEFIDGPSTQDGPRQLLYRLTPAAGGPATLTFVCVPYGGGSAIVYQPLADALPDGYALYSVAIPGHDVGLDEPALPLEELTARVAAEVAERINGPIALYGHCGVGSAIVAEVARILEAAGRVPEAVYIGGMFPFARPRGPYAALRNRLETLRSNRHYADWLKSMGVATDELEPELADRIISNMRADSRASEEYFTRLLDRPADKLSSPIISVVGSKDPVTDYYAERYAEWQFLTDTVGLVVLDAAGHFFLKYRADELAEIVTSVHPAVKAGDTRELEPAARGADAGWTLRQWRRADPASAAGRGVEPSMRRFLTVMVGQLVSSTGSALTAFALPIWLYLQTGSVTNLGLLWALAILSGVLTLPVAGALIDRVDRRRALVTLSCAAGAIQLTLAGLIWSDAILLWQVYLFVSLSQMVGAAQRVAFQSAVPQLVPKRYLGHAMGMVQLSNGIAQLLMPIAAAGLLAVIQLTGILLIDVASYLFAIVSLLLVRFPNAMGWRPREPLLVAIAGGLRYSWQHRGFRMMLSYFAIGNVFLAGALVLIAPLVLSFGTQSQVAQIALAEAAGMIAGGLLMALWGGPRQHRMIGVLIANTGTALGCMVTGLRPSMLVVALGVFLMSCAMALAQGIYATIVQVKVPQRFHGRVFALNQTIAWSTLPIGFALLAPAVTTWLEPMLAPNGGLADTIGAVIGVGPGRGIGLGYLLLGLTLLAVTTGGFAIRVLRRFDTEVEDSLPDDLVGANQRKTDNTPHS